MYREQARIDEHLEDLRLQLLVVKSLSATEPSIDPDTLWEALALEGRRVRASWRPQDHTIVPLYPQILGYFGLMDAIAGALYGEDLGNKQRFVRLLRDYLKWDYAERISIPHLYQLLRTFPLPELDAVRTQVFAVYDGAGTAFTVDLDVEASVVGGWFGGDVSLKLRPTGLTLDDLTHGHLLYRYRSRLVHTMRGYGLLAASRGLATDVVPTYHGISLNGDQHFQLSYPVGVISNLAEAAVGQLPDHVRAWRVSALKRDKFGMYFYPALNQPGPLL